MSDRHFNSSEKTHHIFDDPIGYLAQFGIRAEVVADSVVPLAA